GVRRDDTVAAGVARRFDDRQHLGRRRVARAEDELLLGSDLGDLAKRGQRLAVGAHRLDALGGVLEVLYVVVGVEGRQPHDATVATLHPPHPLHAPGIETTRGAAQRDSAEGPDPGGGLPTAARPAGPAAAVWRTSARLLPSVAASNACGFVGCPQVWPQQLVSRHRGSVSGFMGAPPRRLSWTTGRCGRRSGTGRRPRI